MARKNNKDYNAGGIVFVGFTLLGLGIGAWLDHAISGTIIGIGAGFLAMAMMVRER
jgi:putative effector of murein hydrolase LrgA (UPF0299 family)